VRKAARSRARSGRWFLNKSFSCSNLPECPYLPPALFALCVLGFLIPPMELGFLRFRSSLPKLRYGNVAKRWFHQSFLLECVPFHPHDPPCYRYPLDVSDFPTIVSSDRPSFAFESYPDSSAFQSPLLSRAPSLWNFLLSQLHSIRSP